MHHAVEFDVRMPNIHLVEVLCDLELYRLGLALERLHSLTHDQVGDGGTSCIKLTLHTEKVGLESMDITMKDETVKPSERMSNMRHS